MRPVNLLIENLEKIEFPDTEIVNGDILLN